MISVVFSKFQIPINSQLYELVRHIGIYGYRLVEILRRTVRAIINHTDIGCVIGRNRLALEEDSGAMAGCPGIKNDQQASAPIHKLEVKRVNRLFHPDVPKVVNGVKELYTTNPDCPCSLPVLLPDARGRSHQYNYPKQ